VCDCVFCLFVFVSFLVFFCFCVGGFFFFSVVSVVSSVVFCIVADVW